MIVGSYYAIAIARHGGRRQFSSTNEEENPNQSRFVALFFPRFELLQVIARNSDWRIALFSLCDWSE